MNSRNLFYAITITTSLITNNVYALQLKKTNPDGELEAFISSEEINRIKVKSERIKSVRANAGEIEIIEDSNAGEIYLKPQKFAPINIFITTEDSNTYKLLLLPKKIPAEQIFIENIKSSKVDDGADKYVSNIISMLKKMRASEEIEGFRRSEINQLFELKDLNFHKLHQYESDNLFGEIFEFVNETESLIHLNPDIFEMKNLKALSCDETEVAPNEKTYVYLIRGRSDE